jgi:sulfur carrier protein
MNIVLNGEIEPLTKGETVEQLLRRLKAESGRVAVLVNDNVVGTNARRVHVLEDGDRVEIVTLAAGG